MNEKRKYLECLLYITIIIFFLWAISIAFCAFAADQRTLILTWDQYKNPSGIGIRIYQSAEPGKYNFSKEYAVADVSADVNEVSICIDLDTYNFVATAYRSEDSNNVSEPSNEIFVPPGPPSIKKKRLLGGCGL